MSKALHITAPAPAAAAAATFQRWHEYDESTRISYTAKAVIGILPSQTGWTVNSITVLPNGDTVMATATNAIRNDYLSLTYI